MYAHKEDFFFRTVHLGTECWAFIATQRLRSALQVRSALVNSAVHR
jgi:hypothetical protein